MLKLDQKLRKLRLGYAASVLEAHHQAAINAKISYLEFLEKLIDDELNARDTKGLDKRVRAARFPGTKTLVARIDLAVARERVDAIGGVLATPTMQLVRSDS